MKDLAAVAAAAGAGFAVAKPVAEAASDLAQKLLGRPFTVAGDLLGDQIYYWQCVNRIRVLDRLRAKLEESEFPAKSLPPGFLVPALDAAGNVDDDDLRELWAKLLLNAIRDPDSRSPMFISVLRQMGPAEAQWLHENFGAFQSGYIDRDGSNASDHLLALGVLGHPTPEFQLLPGTSFYSRHNVPDDYVLVVTPSDPQSCIELSAFGYLFVEALGLV